MTLPTNTPAVSEGLAQTYDLGAERMVLGILMSNQAAVGPLVGHLAAEDFYNPYHAEIYQAILSLHADGKPVEPNAVLGRLADTGALARIRGGELVFECYQQGNLPAEFLDHYVARVVDLASRRGLQTAGVRISQAAMTPGHTSQQLAELAQTLIDRAKPRRAQLDFTRLGSLINPALDRIEGRKDAPLGITTGFADLDRLIGGLRGGQLATVAGATSMGKSIAVVDVARHVAIKLGLTVALFSLEMTLGEIFDRILAAEARVHHLAIRDGTLDERDWQRIAARIGPMSDAPLFLADRADMTVAAIRADCEMLRAQHGRLDLVIVDHVHLVDPARPKVEEPARITEISRGLKRQVAMALDVPVLAAAQLNRNPSSRPDKIPELTDLKYSSSIEQDSDIVILLHRPDYYDPDSPRAGEVDFIVAKSRNGPKGIVTVAAQLHLSRFVDMALLPQTSQRGIA